MIDTRAYLERIHYTGPLRNDYETLRQLSLAHLNSVPMETMDIHLGVPLVLNVDYLYRKIVVRHRGGYCYELNGLFAELLRALGFQVDLLSARVTRPGGHVGPEFDHATLRVTIDGTAYMADVGFGDGFAEPMEMVPGARRQVHGRDFRLVERAGELHFEVHDEDGFDKGCILSLVPRRLEEFQAQSDAHCSNPRSWFVRTRLATMATPAGRKTLMNDVLKIHEGDRTTVIGIRNKEHFAQVLRDHFGLRLSRVPRAKGERLSMRLRCQTMVWQHRAHKLCDLALQAAGDAAQLLGQKKARVS